MMKNYRMMLFDMDGTLFDYDQAYRRALGKTLPDLMNTFGPDSVITAFHTINTNLWVELEKGAISLEDLRSMRFAKLFHHFRYESADPRETGRRYIEQLARQAQLFPDTLAVLEQLKRQFRLGIITNGISSVQRSRLKLAGIHSWFNPIVISMEHGVAKPDPEIFRITLHSAGLRATDVLYIGDSITSDMAGADHAGIDFCWFNPEQRKPPDIHPIHFTISTLQELLPLVSTGHISD